jgi:hypothetical protein
MARLPAVVRTKAMLCHTTLLLGPPLPFHAKEAHRGPHALPPLSPQHTHLGLRLVCPCRPVQAACLRDYVLAESSMDGPDLQATIGRHNIHLVSTLLPSVFLNYKPVSIDYPHMFTSTHLLRLLFIYLAQYVITPPGQIGACFTHRKHCIVERGNVARDNRVQGQDDLRTDIHRVDRPLQRQTSILGRSMIAFHEKNLLECCLVLLKTRNRTKRSLIKAASHVDNRKKGNSYLRHCAMAADALNVNLPLVARSHERAHLGRHNADRVVAPQVQPVDLADCVNSDLFRIRFYLWSSKIPKWVGI